MFSRIFTALTLAISLHESVALGASSDLRRQINIENWQQAPYNRYSFQHVSEMIATAVIAKQTKSTRTIETKKDPSILSMTSTSGTPMIEHLEHGKVDGFMAIKNGKIIFEEYRNNMKPYTRHLNMSTSKSITGTLAWIAVQEGLLDPEKLITDYIPELKNSAWQGAKVRHVMDMTSAVKYEEGYENPNSELKIHEQVIGWGPRVSQNLPKDQNAFIKQLKIDDRLKFHGNHYEYRSIETDVLAWIVEASTGQRFHSYLSQKIWSKIGAEYDALITVDNSGIAMADGGMNMTLKDHARFGLFVLEGGLEDSFYNDLNTSSRELISSYKKSSEYEVFSEITGSKNMYYRNQWRVLDPEKEIYLSIGVYGQFLYIDRSQNFVGVIFSSTARAKEVEIVKTNIEFLQMLSGW